MWDAVGRRVTWLGSPAFVATVVTLAVNDHLLKERFPGWWTGKLSDVAGVAMLAVLASVLAGPRFGPALTGMAFVVLKAVPGGAVVAAPILGGVTRQDRTDLVALAVLPPVWWLLERADERRPATSPEIATDRLRKPVLAGRVASTIVPLLAGGSAILTATATQCSPEDAVVQVVFDGPVLYAEIEEGFRKVSWARSDDRGETWTAAASAPPQAAPTPNLAPEYDHVARGPDEACLADGTCFRAREQRFVDRVAADGTVTTELALSIDDRRALSTGCADGQRGVLSSIAVHGEDVVASLGAGGITRRSADGTWDQQAVLGIPVPERTAFDAAAMWLALAVGPVLLAVAGVGHRRWPSTNLAAVAAILGGAGTFVVASGLLFLGENSIGPRPATIAAVTGTLVTVLTFTLLLLHRPRRSPLPPPPTPPRP